MNIMISYGRCSTSLLDPGLLLMLQEIHTLSSFRSFEIFFEYEYNDIAFVWRE